MYILGVNGLGVSFGETVLFENVTFSVNAGARVGVVGKNGAGKTTLFNAISGKDTFYTGDVFISKGKSIGYLEQMPTFSSDMTVLSAGYAVFGEMARLEERLFLAEEKMKNDPSPEAIEEYSKLSAEFGAKGGYEYKSRAKGALFGVGFDERMFDLPVSALSGGQRSMLRLALLVLEEPDIMLLDEPTNHLDIKALEWLEDKLSRIRSTVLVISHDRYFLDKVTTSTLEIENRHAKLYPVSYTEYRLRKKEERDIAERHYKNQQREIARMEEFIAQQRRWNREKNIKAAESRQKAIDRMEKTAAPEKIQDAISFSFSDSTESGEDVLSVRSLKKSYGEKTLFSDLSFEVNKKDRLVIIGANGSGKSTLLQIIAGRENATSGEVKTGYNVRMGYYDQYIKLNEDSTVLGELWSDMDMTHTEARNLLAVFRFFGDDVFKEVRVLSGGERARLALAELLKKKVNLLLLDEPTNHLDIESREALEDAVEGFGGTVVAVAHDRYFINRIGGRILEFRADGTAFLFEGNYSDYLSYKEKMSVSDTERKKEDRSENAALYDENKKRGKEERKIKKRIAFLEEEMEKNEKRMSEIDRESAENASDYVKLQALYEEKEALAKDNEKYFAEWESLL